MLSRCRVVWLILLVSLTIFSLRLNEGWTGDGGEYGLYAESFAQNLTPNIADLEFNRSVYPEWLRKFPNDFGIHPPFVKGSEGLYFYHFWFYSLLVAPFVVIVKSLNFPIQNAFIMCNWAFVFIVLGYIAYFWKASTFQKNFLALLFLTSGTTYYIWWTHPEVFTASLLLLSLLALSDKRFFLSLVASAMAATQNPPVIFLFGLVVFIFSYEVSLKKIGILSKIQRIVVTVTGPLAVALMPFIFYSLTVGVLNPIVSIGASNLNLISISRLESLFFDFNIGMITALWGVFLGLLLSVVYIIFNKKQCIGFNTEKTFLMMLGSLSLLMAIPTLSTTNWNPGISVFMRYGYWVSMPLILGVVLIMDVVPRKAALLFSTLVIILQLTIVGCYGIWGLSVNYLELTPISKYIIKNWPSIYNPDPEIFAERVAHKEYDFGDSVSVFPIKNPKKILLRSNRIQDISKLCELGSFSVVPVEFSWVYINLRNSAKCDFGMRFEAYEQQRCRDC